MGRLYMYIWPVLYNFDTYQIRLNENSLNLSRTLSFPNFIQKQEKLKEENKVLEASN